MNRIESLEMLTKGLRRESWLMLDLCGVFVNRKMLLHYAEQRAAEHKLYPRGRARAWFMRRVFWRWCPERLARLRAEVALLELTVRAEFLAAVVEQAAELLEHDCWPQSDK